MLYADQARSGGLRQQLSCRTNVEAAHRAAPCPQFHGAESSFTGRPLSWNSLARARNSAIKKNQIHIQKNFEFVGNVEASNEIPALWTARRRAGRLCGFRHRLSITGIRLGHGS